VIKRKMSNWKLKRAEHRSPSQPGQRPAGTITIVAATKTGPARIKSCHPAPKSAVLRLEGCAVLLCLYLRGCPWAARASPETIGSPSPALDVLSAGRFSPGIAAYASPAGAGLPEGGCAVYGGVGAERGDGLDVALRPATRPGACPAAGGGLRIHAVI
jgi:hypothetical protein